MRGHHRAVPPKIYDAPICWLPRDIDNSAGGQTWVPPDTFGPLAGLPLHFSYGRCKPMFTAMTDLGKITLYDGVILKRDKERVLLQSHYSYEDRVKWNPLWQKPESVLVDKDGFMQVWYLDGEEEKGGGAS